MKIYTLSLAFIFAIISSFCQTIPNADFENWTNQGSFDEPDEWHTPNPSTSQIGLVSVYKSTDAYNGSASMKLKSASIFTTVVPGMATLGTINVDLQASNPLVIGGGITFTSRPRYIHGYYKYFPAGSDMCHVNAVLIKAGDTIAIAHFAKNDTVDTWTNFTAEFYYTSDEFPDTLNILVMSSGVTGAVSGSELYIDSLSFSGLVGIEDNININNQVALYPNPATTFLNIEKNNKNIEINKIKIYDITGKLIFEKQNIDTSKNTIKLDLSSYKKGLYITVIETNKGRIQKKTTIY